MELFNPEELLSIWSELGRGVSFREENFFHFEGKRVSQYFPFGGKRFSFFWRIIAVEECQSVSKQG